MTGESFAGPLLPAAILIVAAWLVTRLCDANRTITRSRDVLDVEDRYETSGFGDDRAIVNCQPDLSCECIDCDWAAQLYAIRALPEAKQ